MQDLNLTNKETSDLYLECRTDRAINIGVGDTNHYAEMILTYEEVVKLGGWIVTWLELQKR